MYLIWYFYVFLLTFYQHTISQQVFDQELIDSYLQQLSVTVTVLNNRNSIGATKSHYVLVPAHILDDMNIAVTPTANSQDKFWVALAGTVKTEQPLIYNIRYYNYSKFKKGWVLIKGEGVYGWVPHKAIIAAGIEFNNDKSMKASSVKLITTALQHD